MHEHRRQNFEANQKQDQANGVTYSKGTISDSTGTQGSYTHDPDIAGNPAANIAAMGNIGNQGMAAIQAFTVASVAGSATAGAGLAAFGGGIGALTTVEGLSERSGFTGSQADHQNSTTPSRHAYGFRTHNSARNCHRNQGCYPSCSRSRCILCLAKRSSDENRNHPGSRS